MYKVYIFLVGKVPTLISDSMSNKISLKKDKETCEEKYIYFTY